MRRKYELPKADPARQDADTLTLRQATKYCGVSDRTLKRLIDAGILACDQVAPYASLEIDRVDLDSEPAAGILRRLKATGKLDLAGDTSANQMGPSD